MATFPTHNGFVVCCEQMNDRVHESDVFEVMHAIPFKPEQKIEPTLYLFSDGGHGGFFAIRFCPFCGTEVKILNDATPIS